MARLLPCSSCGRHVRTVERECPFCGRVLATVAAPSRLGVALLGLSFAACSSGTEAPAKKANEAPSEKQAPELTPEPAQPEPAQPEPDTEVAATTSAEPTEAGSAGTTDGSSASDQPSTEPKPVPKPKYGAPRPTKKYGAPPPPPLEDPF